LLYSVTGILERSGMFGLMKENNRNWILIIIVGILFVLTWYIDITYFSGIEVVRPNPFTSLDFLINYDMWIL